MNTIELYSGEKICTLGCDHCSRKSDGNKDIKLNAEQADIMIQIQEILSKNTNFE